MRTQDQKDIFNDILVELETSWVTVNEDALLRGYAASSSDGMSLSYTI